MNTTKEIAMFYRYLREGITAFFNDDLNLIKSLSPNLICIPFESLGTRINGPDFLIHIPNSNKIIAVEHFEFDSSRKINRKGNQSRIELARINRDFKKLTLKEGESSLCGRDQINCNWSGNNYVENFFIELYNHLENTEDYISNILKVFPEKTKDDIILTFMIMDTTPLGSYLMTEDRLIPFSFLQLKIFRNMSYKDNNLSGFFSAFHHDSTSKIYYCSSQNLKSLNETLIEIDLTKQEYFAFSPQVSRILMKLE